MTGKNWQASGKNAVTAVGLVYAVVAAPADAWAAASGFSPNSYISGTDPGVVWEILVRGFIAISFLAAVAICVMSGPHKVNRAHLRRHALISSALNNLNQAGVMRDSHCRIL